MEYRTHQGVRLSEIGVGCYALSGAYGPKDPQAFADMLRRAVELGVTFFDTAGAYGEGERLLGQALKPYRQQVLIATKVGVKEGESRTDLSAASVRSACERSLKLLDSDTIDLYQVHFDDPATPVEETLAALEDLLQAGKIRRYGVCHLPASRVAEYCRKGHVFSILMELSAAAREARDGLLPLACRYGAAAIAFSVTGRGLLTGQVRRATQFAPGDIRRIDPLFQRERLDSALRIADWLAALGRRYGKTPAQAAIAWALAQPGIVCALTGPSTRAHLEENLGGSGWRLAGEDLAALEHSLEAELRALQAAQRLALRLILAGPLPPDPLQAFTDLAYAIETALLAGWAEEQQVMPLFLELFGLSKQLGQTSVAALEHIRRELNERVSLA